MRLLVSLTPLVGLLLFFVSTPPVSAALDDYAPVAEFVPQTVGVAQPCATGDCDHPLQWTNPGPALQEGLKDVPLETTPLTTAPAAAIGR
jgi:hypothetical protein